MRITRSLLRAAFGNSWKTFISGSLEELEEMTDVLIDDLNWGFNRYRESPTFAEGTIYGAGKKVRYEFDDQRFLISFTSVSFDPLLRAFGPLMMTEENLEEYRNSVSIINIEPILDKEHVSEFLCELTYRMDDHPWEISHPRFTFSPLLRAKVRVYWMYWLNHPDNKDVGDNNKIV